MVSAIPAAAAEADRCGWVCCPLCPVTSMRRFRLGRGLREHADAVHGSVRDAACADDEAAVVWHRMLAEQASSQGLFAQRSAAGLGRADGRQRRRASNAAGDEPIAAATVPRRWTVGLTAARDGDLPQLAALLASGWRPYEADELDHNGASALDWAAGAGHAECVELLLTHSAGGVLASRRDGRGPAHQAARFGHPAVLEHLLENGVSVESRTTTGVTMLMLASYGGHVAACELLLRHGAQLQARNSFDCDCGHFAAMGGSADACRWLLGHGLAFNRPQCSGHTALHKAAENGQVDVVRLLLDGWQPAVLPAAACLPENTRKEVKLPSVLAERAGHAACVDVLRAAGL